MICNLLCVGTELLLGQIDDTNSSYIGRTLADIGIVSLQHRRVGDNHKRIFQAMSEMLDISDVLIVTGGLGPTHDDITRDVAAEIMGVELEKDESIVATMERMFEKRKRKMTTNNIRQAMVPIGATVLKNPLGTAPGLQCPVDINGTAKTMFLVPGVPKEMQYLLNEYIVPFLIENSPTNSIVTRTLKTWGLPEAALADMLDSIVQKGETDIVKVGFLARGINGIYVKLSASAPTKEQAMGYIAPVEKQVLHTLGDKVYAFDEETMESVVIDILRQNSLTLACAESLTGGMVSSRLVNTPGASDVFLGSVVSYDPSIKSSVLGVRVEDVYTAECAIQMARGVRQKFNADIAISTTGVAGPGPDLGHDQGEVFIGVSTIHGESWVGLNLGGDRQQVRDYATISALNVLRHELLGNPLPDSSS